MHNIRQIFTRDVKRLARVPKAWIIIVGVIVTPSLYAWFNIVGFWNPYENTEHVRVAVVNLDEGASSEATGTINVGKEVTTELRTNHDLGWQFMDETGALESVRSGESYAAIVIPKEFSKDLLSITSGTFTQPRLQYFVNEKANAIAPKITDVGASTLEQQISNTFTAMVAQTVSKALKDAGTDTELRLLAAKDSTANSLNETRDTVLEAREHLIDLQERLEDSRGRVANASLAIERVDTALEQVQTALDQSQAIVGEVQDEVVAFTDAATRAYVDAAALLAETTSRTNASIQDVANAVQRGGSRAENAIETLERATEASGEAIAELEKLAEKIDDPALSKKIDSTIKALKDRQKSDQETLENLRGLTASTSATAQAIAELAATIETAAQDAQNASQQVRSIVQTTVPELQRALSRLSSSAGSLSHAIDAQRTQVTQARTLLNDLDGQIDAAEEALAHLEANLDSISDGLQTARTDVLALGTASIWQNLAVITGLNADEIADFMASPVTVEQHTEFPVQSYGAAMASLFTNLALWIGAFVLTVIFKLEVDREGLQRVTVRQAYLGRWSVLAVLAVCQAILVTVGNLVIGVETVNPFAYVATGIFIGLTYFSIIFALCMSFGVIGKGLSVLLVIMQIPGASGLYPIEMMPGFFRALYPFLPFTYGIDAMRETISGFYGTHVWRYIGALTIFMVLAFVLGLFLRKRLIHFNRFFKNEVARTDLFISEHVHITGRGYRLADLLHALSNQREYRAEMRTRTASFATSYPQLKRWGLIGGAACLSALGIVSWLTPGAKAGLLGLWVLSSLAIIGYLVTIEYLRFSAARAGEVAEMNTSELHDALTNRGQRGDSHRPNSQGASQPLPSQGGRHE